MNGRQDAAAVNQEWAGGTTLASPDLLDEQARGRRSGITDPKQIEKLQKLETLHRRLAIAGVRTGWVLNMNPYPLRVNGVLLDDTIVPACPLGQSYIAFPIRNAMIAWRDDKDGEETPVEFLPVMLIRDFEHLYYKQGGVVVFEATGNPKKPLSVEDEIANNPDLQEKMAQARERMFTFANAKYMEAETYFHSPGRVGYREISDIHRNMTALLYANRMLPDKPKWFEATKAESDVAEQCARCKAETKKGATICAACGFVVDPAEAFRVGDLDPANESDKRALMRLSREQLEELNISHLVEENLEERNERLADEAKKAKK